MSRNAPSPFSGLDLPCICEGYQSDMCACGDEERVLRNIKATDGTMTIDQRAWCIDQIRWVGDNTNQPTDDELAAMSAKELAYTTLAAWSDYVSSVT